jgi:hypothetical protein
MTKKYLVRFQVLTAASMMFRAVFCIHPWWWRQYAPLKRRSTIILHGSTTQKTALKKYLDLLSRYSHAGKRGKGYIARTHSCGWMVSVTPRSRFTPGERTPGTDCTGGWVGLRAGLDTEVRGNILCLCRGSNLDRSVVQSVARHSTDWATPAPCTELERCIIC